VLARLGAELAKVMKLPDVVERFNALGVRSASGSAQELARFQQDELDKYGKLIRAGNIQVD